MSHYLEKLRINLGVNMTKEKFNMEKTTEVSNNLYYYKDKQPNILKMFYIDDKLRQIQECEDKLDVFKNFEMRKVDTKYF